MHKKKITNLLLVLYPLFLSFFLPLTDSMLTKQLQRHTYSVLTPLQLPCYLLYALLFGFFILTFFLHREEAPRLWVIVGLGELLFFAAVPFLPPMYRLLHQLSPALSGAYLGNISTHLYRFLPNIALYGALLYQQRNLPNKN